MLLTFLVILTLTCLATWVVATATERALRRLGVDVAEALVWLGIATWPVDEPRGRRLGQVIGEPL